MYLQKVEVKNFRNLKNFSVEFHKGLNVIVGENNIGKTNLFDAIRLALGYQSTSDPVKISIDDFHYDSQGARCTDPISVDLSFGDLSISEQAQFLEILNFNASDSTKSTASVHWLCSWNDLKERAEVKRWGGLKSTADRSNIPEEVLQSIQITFLTALRDAASSLNPGRQSRLGKLLATNATDPDKTAIKGIFDTANSDLADETLIQNIEGKLNNALQGSTGPNMSQKVAIRSTEADFENIVRGLKLVLKTDLSSGHFTKELKTNGLGYNNLLFMATVLAELETLNASTLPLFFVEEPEAHLHPQLQTVLIKFLQNGLFGNERRKVQTFVTSHSPNIVSCVPTDNIVSIHRGTNGDVRSFCLKNAGLEPMEKMKVQRMMDVTKSAFLFSRGVIFVEGVTEGLLIPVIADRMNKNLEDRHISVIPVCGIDFGSIVKLFGENKLNLKVSVITDGDPSIIVGPEKQWKLDIPEGYADGNIEPCKRAVSLVQEIGTNAYVKPFVSEITLEFDLAATNRTGTTQDVAPVVPEGEPIPPPEVAHNAVLMKSVWESMFRGNESEVMSTEDFDAEASIRGKGLVVWRGICRSSTSKSKADFAHLLCETLAKKNPEGSWIIETSKFNTPNYIKQAVEHVAP